MISVLYVDDEPFLLDICKIYLEKTGAFRVTTSVSAADAELKLASGRYDAVVSDYQMPDIDGITFLKYIRSNYAGLPFILFTGRGREEVVIEAINNGADFYLQKGGDPTAQFAELVQKIRTAVGKRRAEEALIKQTGALGERVKELNCLYRLAEIINRPGSPLEEMLQRCADLIPSGYQHPECTAARITFGDREFATAGFRDSVWNQRSPILVTGSWAGTVEIAYTGEWADPVMMPFLSEESTLLSGVANMLGNSIARKIAEDRDRRPGASPAYDGAGLQAGSSELRRMLADEAGMRYAAEKRLGESIREKEALLREVSFRVTNSLRTVNSLLDLQSRYIKNGEIARALGESQNRIRAMALVHEILYMSPELSRIDMERYVKTLGDYLLGFYGDPGKRISVRTDIHDLFLGIDSAIPLGLIIHELMSNSLKHAFRDRNAGEITISLKREGRSIPVVYTDDGVGIPVNVNWRDIRTLGLRMVFSLVEQMNGTIGLDRSNGTAFTMVLEERE